eukprot:924383_1
MQCFIMDTKTLVPLHQFTPQQLCYHIKQWVLADVNDQNNIAETHRKFKQREFHGEKICTEPMNNIKDMMEKDLLQFMTRKTFNIIMVHCQEWKDRNIDDLKSKSADEMADILFHYPLNRLLDRIIGQNIDGKRFIQSVIAPNEDIIAEETGWHDDEVYQIQSILFRHHSCTQSQFERNMNDVLSKQPSKLSKDIADRIKGVMARHNIEETHYKIKNALNIDAFADSVMNMVDEYTQNENKENPKVIVQIYRTIAQCFVFTA